MRRTMEIVEMQTPAQKAAFEKTRQKGTEASAKKRKGLGREASKPLREPETPAVKAQRIGRKSYKADKEHSRKKYDLGPRHHETKKAEKKAAKLDRRYREAAGPREKARQEKGMGRASTGKKGVKGAWRKRHAAKTGVQIGDSMFMPRTMEIVEFMLLKKKGKSASERIKEKRSKGRAEKGYSSARKKQSAAQKKAWADTQAKGREARIGKVKKKVGKLKTRIDFHKEIEKEKKAGTYVGPED